MRGKAKEQAEIDSEKEIVETATVQAMGKNKYGDVTKTGVEEIINKSTGERKTEVIEDEENVIVKFVDSNRYYKIDTKGNVEKIEVTIDQNPGNIKVGINGEELDGLTENTAFEIWSIEDLVEWSKNYSMYTNSYIVLEKTLNFKSELSYCNSSTTEYNNFLGVDSDVPLIEILTNKEYDGFIPITEFNGIFDAQGYKINNLYINSSLGFIGLFGETKSSSVIKNLSISGQIIQNSTINNCSVGGIVGYGLGRIEFCNNSCHIKKLKNNHYGCGGISGYFNGTIYCCVNNGTIESAGLAGGITGTGTATIINCYNQGNVTVSGDWAASGINGGDVWSNKSNIYNCYNIGNMTCEAYSIYACPSGIFGYMPNGMTSLNIVNCWNTGETIASCWNKGGIIGFIRGITPNVLNCSYIETGTNQTSIAKPYSQSYMQSQEFTNELNHYIESNEDGIDTKGWAKWIQVYGEYPTLDFNTIWDGEKWVTDKY